MNDQRVPEVLDASVAEVLETMCFAFPEGPLPDGEAPPEGESVGAAIEFTGGAKGRFTLTVGREAARGLACSFLGAEPEEIDEGRSSEVLREVANMICGSALSSLESGQHFDLSEPRAEGRGFTGKGRRFAIENGFLEACFEIETVSG
ncbi:MAG TPA: hypothetical protein DEH78_26315 [Solibacterales bacterium]|nr:hypothetical protein [Bryobacterales bacterium]